MVFKVDLVVPYFIQLLDDLLLKAMKFLSSTDYYWQLVINVARKIDAKYWVNFFTKLDQSPTQIFETCLELKLFPVCISCLVILHELTSLEDTIVTMVYLFVLSLLQSSCLSLIQKLLVNDAFEQVLEIVRFSLSISSNTDEANDNLVDTCPGPLNFPVILKKIEDELWDKLLWYLTRGLVHSWYTLSEPFIHLDSIKRYSYCL